jgi:hypothetical protein
MLACRCTSGAGMSSTRGGSGRGRRELSAGSDSIAKQSTDTGAPVSSCRCLVTEPSLIRSICDAPCAGLRQRHVMGKGRHGCCCCYCLLQQDHPPCRLLNRCTFQEGCSLSSGEPQLSTSSSSPCVVSIPSHVRWQVWLDCARTLLPDMVAARYTRRTAAQAQCSLRMRISRRITLLPQ